MTIFTILQMIAGLIFFVTLYIGYYMWKNYEKLFGVDRTMPSENGSARAYSKIQVFSLWAHLLVASGAFALLLH